MSATDSPKPGDFPVGSPASRAAARMLAQHRNDQRERLEIIIRGEEELRATPWTEDFNGSGKLMRVLCVPDGMTIEEAQRIVDGH